MVNTAPLYHSHINLERASCWKIKVKRKQLLHPQWVQVPGRTSWSERIRVDIRKMEGNKTPKPNRSIKGWCGVKDRNCQGLPAAKWNQFLWVQACQDVVGSYRHLHCFANQWKGHRFLRLSQEICWDLGAADVDDYPDILRTGVDVHRWCCYPQTQKFVCNAKVIPGLNMFK